MKCSKPVDILIKETISALELVPDLSYTINVTKVSEYDGYQVYLHTHADITNEKTNWKEIWLIVGIIIISNLIGRIMQSSGF